MLHTWPRDRHYHTIPHPAGSESRLLYEGLPTWNEQRQTLMSTHDNNTGLTTVAMIDRSNNMRDTTNVSDTITTASLRPVMYW